MKTPLQQLEQKIFDKLPELKQLGVGCEMKFKETDELIFTCFAIKDEFYRFITQNAKTYAWNKDQVKESFNIIGKPPTLVDVRNWIRTLEKTKPREYIYNYILSNWNDSIYLRDQDEVLINFLNNLEK